MATRQEKITRASELIKASPDAGRRNIAADLRQEFGTGLRDAVILKLQRAQFAVKAEPFLFAEPTEKQFKPLRQSRYNKLVEQNFTRKEARAFSKLPLTQITFLKDTRKARALLLKTRRPLVGFNKAETKIELQAIIDNAYTDNGWTDRDGENNPYIMLREFRRDAILAGTWDPEKDSPSRKPRSRSRRRLLANKARYRKLNKETIAATAKIYRRENKEKIAENKRIARQKEKVR